MANEFKIYERNHPSVVVNGVASPIQGKRLVGQELTVATEVTSSAFGTGVDYIQLKTTLDCFYRLDGTAAATSSSIFLAAGEVTEEQVQAGDTISVIAA